MTQKEKNYLLDMLYNSFNRSEMDYYYYLERISRNHIDSRALIDVLLSLVETNAYSKTLKNTIELLNCRQFDDNYNIYRSRTQQLLANYHITKEQDDLIFSYAMFVINNK